ncbi:MAG: exopolysaccharide biosynthesis protein [Opitutaceae bacterium]|jgi:hypothetical protein|nr:exopolysaccharide biosynthesis protein [Opitutaceae bacterium]
MPQTEPPNRALLSEKLSALAALTHERPVPLGEVAASLGGNAAHLLNFILALPFVIPLPTAGLSTALGLVIAAGSLRLIQGREPGLPAKLAAKTLPAGFLSKLLRASRRVVLVLEKLLRPRLVRFAGAARLHAALVFCAALVLLLPLPIPFSNTFPAWSILLAAAGLLERDGLAILAGYLVALAGVACLFLAGCAGAGLWEQIRGWF